MPPLFEMPPNDGGATPMTVNGRLLIVTGFPTAACTDPKADRASRVPITTTGEPAGPRSSSALKLRPALSRTPRTSKKSAVTRAVPASRGSPPIDRLAVLS
jgi:hypothetical protein